MVAALLRTKSLSDIQATLTESEGSDRALKRTLTTFDLVMLGIGAVIGAGIFPSIGTGVRSWSRSRRDGGAILGVCRAEAVVVDRKAFERITEVIDQGWGRAPGAARAARTGATAAGTTGPARAGRARAAGSAAARTAGRRRASEWRHGLGLRIGACQRAHGERERQATTQLSSSARRRIIPAAADRRHPYLQVQSSNA